MKSKIVSFIMMLISMLILMALGIFGVIIYEEFIKTGNVDDVKEFVSNIVMVGEEPKEEDLSPQVLSVETEKTSSLSNQRSENISKKYFYNQLDNYSKKIYNSIQENKENMKSGTYEIELDKDIANLMGTDNGEELVGEYFQKAIDAYTYDNPEIFYIDFTKLYMNMETTTKGNKKSYKIFLNEGNGYSYLKDNFSTKAKVDSAMNEVEQIRNYIIQNKKSDDYQNVKMVHDYLVENIEYDEVSSGDNAYNLYGALIYKKCVCEGYAEAFKYIMDGLNIPCVIVSGKATNSEGKTENHAWNYVQLNGNWYAIDCTWDDPILVGYATLTNSLKYKYFLKGSNEFNESHKAEGQFSTGGNYFDYPQLSVQNY